MEEDVRLLLESIRFEMRDGFAAVRGEIAETRQQLRVAFEEVSGRIDFVAEAVQLLDGKVDRNIERLDEAMDEGFGELVSLIHSTYGHVDKRISALEQ